jgi:hypothetical protein
MIPIANQPAFPHKWKGNIADYSAINPGLTKREYFAGLAMQGVLANESFTTKWYKFAEAPSDYYRRVAAEARWFSDALIAELDKAQ